MKNKIIALIVVYVLSIGTNFLTAIKYPEFDVTVLNLSVSLIFLIVILLTLKSISLSYLNRLYNFILLFGALSGVCVYLIANYDHNLHDNVILDAISNIQIPLYGLFTVPLFGINYFFDVSYGVFALITSMVYIALMISSYLIRKKFQ